MISFHFYDLPSSLKCMPYVLPKVDLDSLVVYANQKKCFLKLLSHFLLLYVIFKILQEGIECVRDLPFVNTTLNR